MTTSSITPNFSFLLKTREQIQEEFPEFRDEPFQEACSESLLPENYHKNRYSNTLPFNMNRVKLALEGRATDYINASLCLEGRVILCQGPLPITRSFQNAHFDFYSMLDQYNVRDVLMVTNWQEGDVKKCDPYMPYSDAEPKICGTYTIHSDHSVQVPALSQLGIQMTRLFIEKVGQEKKVVNHYFFPDWSDYTGSSGKTVAALARIGLESIAQDNRRVVIHCSAGIGRSGTVAAVINASQRMQECIASHEPFSDSLVQTTVEDLRSERVNCVNRNQYETIYEALKELYDVQDFSKEESKKETMQKIVRENPFMISNVENARAKKAKVMTSEQNEIASLYKPLNPLTSSSLKTVYDQSSSHESDQARKEEPKPNWLQSLNRQLLKPQPSSTLKTIYDPLEAERYQAKQDDNHTDGS